MIVTSGKWSHCCGFKSDKQEISHCDKLIALGMSCPDCIDFLMWLGEPFSITLQNLSLYNGVLQHFRFYSLFFHLFYPFYSNSGLLQWVTTTSGSTSNVLPQISIDSKWQINLYCYVRQFCITIAMYMLIMVCGRVTTPIDGNSWH